MNLSIFISHLIALLKRLALVIVLFTVTRLLFLLFSLTFYRPFEYEQVFRAFFYGIRFDFIAIFYLNILFILFHLFAMKFTGRQFFQIFLKYLFVVVNTIALLGNYIDIGFFEFSGKRSGWDLIVMLFGSSDTLALLPDYIINYWYIALMWIASIIILIRLYPALRMKEYKGFSSPIVNVIISPVLAILIFGSAFIYARGIEAKPIRIISANNYVKPKYIPLLFNTPFKILNTINQYSETIPEYYLLNQLSGIFSPVHKLHDPGKFQAKNVFIIILESFGENYTEALFENGESCAPFFKSFQEKGLNCTNAYANAINSIGALPTITGGFPSFIEKTAFVSSAYSTNILRGLGEILKEEGYQTAFFHGGLNGTMGFDKYCQMAGIEHYYGRTEFDNDEYFDGAWGIYDEEFLQFTAEKLDEFEEPFFTVLFTLSSHDPYTIPKKYKDDFFPDGNKVLRSVAYTDYALKKFFETAQDMDWFENTLFILCPDHISSFSNEKTDYIQNRIPIVYYCKADTLMKGEYKAVTQQLDIFPSVLDYLKYSKSFMAFGKSIFRKEYKFVVSKSGVNFQLIDSAIYLDFDGEKSIRAQYHINDSLYGNALPDSNFYFPLENISKAFLQNYYYRLNKNLLADTLLLDSRGNNK